MDLNTFKDWALGQGQVGNPGNGSYLGQCVSLIQNYLYYVYGIEYQARGNAKDWPYNSNVLQYFDKVSSPQRGDIGVMGSNFGEGNGHIFIYLDPNTILEQNGRVPFKISTGSPYANPIAILRHKGTVPEGGEVPASQDMADKTTVQLAYQGILLRDATDNDLAMRVGKQTVEQLLRDLNTSPEHGQVVSLYEEGKSGGGQYEPVTEPLYTKK